MLKYTTAVLFLLIIKAVNCQELSYTNKNGLPSNNVYSIQQDKKGFTWANTDKGVVKFDGRNFKLFTIDNGLASNDNLAMLIDTKDNVWLYSFKAISKIEPNGICKVFGNTKNYYGQFLINSNDELMFSVLDKIDLQTNKSMYNNFILKNDSLIKLDYKISAKSRSITGYFYNIDNVFMHIQYDFKDEKFDLSGPNIVFKSSTKNSNNNNDLAIKIPIITESHFIPNFKYLKRNHAIAFSSVGYRIHKNGLLSDTYIYPYNMKKKSNGEIMQYNERLYLVFNKGIYSYDIESDKWAFFLNMPKATSILFDNEKNIWISTMGDGIIKYSNLDLVSGQETVSKLSKEPIKKVTGNKDQSLWVANSKNEVFELTNKNIKYFPDLIDLRFLETDNEGDIYFGGSNAVFKNSEIFGQFGFKAINLFNDSIAVSTPFGINFVNKKNLQPNKLYDNGQRIDISGRMYAILLLQGKFYSGNQQGLFWGKPNIDTLHPICLDGENASISVIGIKRTNDGLIWVATEGNGIYILENDVVIRHLYKELLDANIHTIKTDEKDRVWVATRKGVNMIHKVGADFNVDKYTSFHGLPDDYVNDIYCYDDILYVATDEGLVKLDISQINKMNFYLPPPIHINSMKVLGSSWKKVRQDSIHKFEHNENTINFEYSGISYKSNGKVRFEYRLSPSVKEWLQTPNDNITFNNLEPNNYIFEVRAIDAIGNISKVPAKAEFVIKKHFTEQLWFSFLIWLLALFLVLFITLRYLKFRRLQVEESSRVEKLISELRLKSLQSQLNPHFVFNSLNAIQQFINTENKKSANDYLSKFSRLMRLYLNGSDSQFITMRQELDVLKLYCSLEHLRFADKFNYLIEIDETLPLDQFMVPAMLLQPHVENAIRHGLIPSNKDNNFLKISVKGLNDSIVCEINDNGIGRAKSVEIKSRKSSDHRSMGNKISKERLEMIRALKLGNISEVITDLVDDSDQPMGTKVVITINQSPKHINKSVSI
jgi:hypothetical protein